MSIYFFVAPEIRTQKRHVWNAESQDVILQAFPDILNPETKLPSGDAINSFIKRTPILRNSTEPRIRSWVHAQRKKIESPSVKKQERNTVPNFIHSIFGKHIKAGKIPSYTECINALSKSPTSMTHYSVDSLRKFVKKAIENKRV